MKFTIRDSIHHNPPKAAPLVLCLLASLLPAAFAGPKTVKPPTIRAGVIGGMTLTRLWDDITRMFEQETGERVQLVVTGQRPELAQAMKEGRLDVLTMHSGDITTNLVAEGYARNMRPWTRNDLVIAGPPSDPAHVRGLNSGAEAFRRIAAAKANYMDFKGIGAREVTHKLWRLAGIDPSGPWVLKDASGDHLNVLAFAAAHNAYVIVGRIPVLEGKLDAHGMEILVEGDPEMRRPYIVLEANPARFPHANVTGAHRLADFLLSPKVQNYLATSPRNRRKGIPLFHPVVLAQ